MREVGWQVCDWGMGGQVCEWCMKGENVLWAGVCIVKYKIEKGGLAGV